MLGVKLGLLALGSNSVGYLKRGGRSRTGVELALPGREKVRGSRRGTVGRLMLLRRGDGEPFGDGVRPGEDLREGGLCVDSIRFAADCVLRGG
jgi:hypothetical protein